MFTCTLMRFRQSRRAPAKHVSGTDEGLRSSYAGFVHEVLRPTRSGCDAARVEAGARSDPYSDRGDDSQDQAVRPGYPEDDLDGVCRDPGHEDDSWSRPHHRSYLRSDSRRQGAIRSKSRCGCYLGLHQNAASQANAIRNSASPRQATPIFEAY